MGENRWGIKEGGKRGSRNKKFGVCHEISHIIYKEVQHLSPIALFFSPSFIYFYHVWTRTENIIWLQDQKQDQKDSTSIAVLDPLQPYIDRETACRNPGV